MESQTEIEKKLRQLIDEIRCYLREDGGDVEFVRYEAEYRDVYVRMTGNCKTCPFAIYTLRAGIERYIKKEIPEIHRIENSI